MACKKEEPIIQPELIQESQIGKWRVFGSSPGISGIQIENFEMELLPDHSLKILNYKGSLLFNYQYWITSIDESEIQFYRIDEDDKVHYSFIYDVTIENNNRQIWEFNFDNDIYEFHVTRLE